MSKTACDRLTVFAPSNPVHAAISDDVLVQLGDAEGFRGAALAILHAVGLNLRRVLLIVRLKLLGCVGLRFGNFTLCTFYEVFVSGLHKLCAEASLALFG